MKFIYENALEIFTGLIFSKTPIVMDNTWLSQYSFALSCNFEEYLKKMKLDQIIKCKSLGDENKTQIILYEKDALEKYLHEYLLLYKNGELEPDENEYLEYENNLFYMKRILDKFSKNFQKKILKLDKIVFLSHNHEKVRFFEFVLELYFCDYNHKRYIEIINSEILPFKGGFGRVCKLDIIIKLLKTPKEIYDFLYNTSSIISKVEMEVIQKIRQNPNLDLKDINELMGYSKNYLSRNVMSKIYIAYGVSGHKSCFNKLKMLLNP